MNPARVTFRVERALVLAGLLIAGGCSGETRASEDAAMADAQADGEAEASPPGTCRDVSGDWDCCPADATGGAPCVGTTSCSTPCRNGLHGHMSCSAGQWMPVTGYSRAWAAPATPGTRRLVFFADTFALPAPGVVTVQEYGSSPRHRHRSVSTKTTSLLERFSLASIVSLNRSSKVAGASLRGVNRRRREGARPPHGTVLRASATSRGHGVENQRHGEAR